MNETQHAILTAVDGAPIRPEKPSWWALIFTFFIAFVFLDPLQRHAGAIEWTLTIAGVVVFFALYIAAIVLWSRHGALITAAVALLGFLFAPFNAGAALYIIYATSFVPYVFRGEAKPVAKFVGCVLALVLLETWIFHLGWVFPSYSVAYAVVFGVGNSWAARQAFSVERLAKIAERERIARDLHDVLGHALSVIILKSELAGKLVEHDPARAKAEIGDVERVSRDALAEVRRTISGYRSEDLGDELARAKSTLETAGVSVETHVSDLRVHPTHEVVLALALREAVTNVVRHARARHCRLQLLQRDGACRLEVQDDGQGGEQVEGQGLRGMRERIEALGGSVVRSGEAGTRLTITLPLPADSRGRA